MLLLIEKCLLLVYMMFNISNLKNLNYSKFKDECKILFKF